MRLITKILDIWPKRWVTTALAVLCILYLTLVPRPLPDNDINVPGLDKVVHAVMFGGLVYVAGIDLSRMRRRCYRQLPVGRAVCVAVAAALLGGVIEIAQYAMNMGRGGDFYDFLADMAGAAAGIWLSMKSIATWTKQNPDRSC